MSPPAVCQAVRCEGTHRGPHGPWGSSLPAGPPGPRQALEALPRCRGQMACSPQRCSLSSLASSGAPQRPLWRPAGPPPAMTPGGLSCLPWTPTQHGPAPEEGVSCYSRRGACPWSGHPRSPTPSYHVGWGAGVTGGPQMLHVHTTPPLARVASAALQDKGHLHARWGQEGTGPGQRGLPGHLVGRLHQETSEVWVGLTEQAVPTLGPGGPGRPAVPSRPLIP